MTPQELERMKQTPGLYLISDTVLVASLNGKIYGVTIDNELSDDGWHESATISCCIHRGTFYRRYEGKEQ